MPPGTAFGENTITPPIELAGRLLICRLTMVFRIGRALAVIDMPIESTAQVEKPAGTSTDRSRGPGSWTPCAGDHPTT